MGKFNSSKNCIRSMPRYEHDANLILFACRDMFSKITMSWYRFRCRCFSTTKLCSRSFTSSVLLCCYTISVYVYQFRNAFIVSTRFCCFAVFLMKFILEKRYSTYFKTVIQKKVCLHFPLFIAAICCILSFLICAVFFCDCLFIFYSHNFFLFECQTKCFNILFFVHQLSFWFIFSLLTCLISFFFYSFSFEFLFLTKFQLHCVQFRNKTIQIVNKSDFFIIFFFLHSLNI